MFTKNSLSASLQTRDELTHSCGAAVVVALHEGNKNGQSGDIESFREVLTAHLMTVNKARFAKKTGIVRRTLYDLMDPNKDFNPELSTISAVIRSLAA